MKTLMMLLVVLTLTSGVRADERETRESQRAAQTLRLEDLIERRRNLIELQNDTAPGGGHASLSLEARQVIRAELAELDRQVVARGGPPLSAATAAPVVERTVREFKEADFDPRFATGRPVGNGRPSDGVWRTRFNHTAVVEAIDSPIDGPHTVTVLSLDEPGVTQPQYALQGEVEYFGVEGKAYLELWNDFPGNGPYFSRTLGASGPDKAITGTSAKRPFVLPFNSEPGKVPTKLTLNVVLPGRGRVMLSNLRLVEGGPTTTAATTPTLEARMRDRREAARLSGGDSASATPTDPELAKQSISSALTASDVTRNADGDVVGFAFTQPDPTGTRLMTLREYEPGVGGLPHMLTGRLTWRGVTGPAAKVGYWYDDEHGNRRPSPASFKTTGADGSATFEIPIVDRRSRHLTVAIVCPGPGAFEVELPGSLSPASRLTAWVADRFWLIFGGLLAVSLMLIVPLGALARRGRGRPVALAFFGLVLAVGVLEVFAAGVALGMGRPPVAWGPLLGTAVIAIAIPAVVIPRLRRRYAEAELRKLRAFDVPA